MAKHSECKHLTGNQHRTDKHQKSPSEASAAVSAAASTDDDIIGLRHARLLALGKPH